MRVCSSDGLTDDQKRRQLSDLQTQQNNLFVLHYGGYITRATSSRRLSAIQAEIDQLNKELAGASATSTNVAAPMNTPSGGGHSIAGTGYATIGDAYADSVQNVAAPMNTPQSGSSFDNSGYANVGAV